MLHKKHTCMGISLIEILIALLLISIAGTFIVPTFLQKQQDVVKKQFITNFTTLVQDALYEATTTQKIHQVYINIKENFMLLKIYDSSAESSNKHQKFKPAYPNAAPIIIPQQIVVKNFYIQEQEDEFANNKVVNDVWFYIMPNGTSQAIVMNVEYDDETSEKSDQFSLVVNPFYSQVYQYDAFQKP